MSVTLADLNKVFEGLSLPPIAGQEVVFTAFQASINSIDAIATLECGGDKESAVLYGYEALECETVASLTARCIGLIIEAYGRLRGRWEGPSWRTKFHWLKLDEIEWAYITPSGRVLLSVLADDAPIGTWAVTDGTLRVPDGQGGSEWVKLARFTTKQQAMGFVEGMFK